MKSALLTCRCGLNSAAGRGWLALALIVVAAMAAITAGGAPRQARAADPAASDQRDYASPQQASEALLAAMRSNDQAGLLQVLGPRGQALIQSGDPVADRNARQRLVGAYDAAHRVESNGPNLAALIVGLEQWPLPIPLVRQGERWHFDTDSSAQKILDRRVGRNELNVIEVCRAYVAAQRQYASEHPLGDRLHEYAPRFESSPGKHDGLFWNANPGEPQSPLGPLVASARAEGYPEPGQRATPYHGYYYRILTSQGEHAPGGARDYIVTGHMTGGFALLAFPAKWGDSGIMTFLVNQYGIVFEKNLGPDTERIARSITKFDPDLDWRAP